MTRRVVVVRAPNHLGDGVMARPAVAALARVADVIVHAPPWALQLYGDLPVRLRPRGRLEDGDVAVLLAPSLRAAWEARHLPVRIGTPTDHRAWLLTHAVPPARHTADTYARLARFAGAGEVGQAPSLALPGDEAPPEVAQGHLALNPLSARGAVREWKGWAELARRSPHPVVFYGGPGETARLAAVAGGFPTQVGLPLPALAAALRRARLMVSVDTGPAHFARALGVPTLVIHGSTDPAGSGPAGALAVEGEAPCRPCYGRRCHNGTLACLDLPVSTVWRATEAALG